jgi:hypothetical protein
MLLSLHVTAFSAALQSRCAARQNKNRDAPAATPNLIRSFYSDFSRLISWCSRLATGLTVSVFALSFLTSSGRRRRTCRPVFLRALSLTKPIHHFLALAAAIAHPFAIAAAPSLVPISSFRPGALLPENDLLPDSAGGYYGTTPLGGAEGFGTIYRLVEKRG